ncbi:hypothetical protein JYU34_004453 [Plutella xylostella]|uniref:FLYWCH-type domain-containing protein n=1 Tax=Plutella xylostella TaxID=51655 RepID=A0ABQ7QY15_PLUXY|nr:hypothetical protein JYU34_004453 [Plutella xylostella]
MGLQPTEVASYGVSRHGKPVLQLGGHRFNHKYETAGRRAYWICVKARLHGCKSTIITIGDEIVSYNDQHKHYH